MATVETPTTIRGGWKPYRLTVDQFLTMIGEGILPDDARVELLGGILVEQMTKTDEHNFAVSALGRRFARLLPENWLMSEEKSVGLGRYWRPEPDIAILRGPEDAYRGRAPAAPDVGILVEVSLSSYAIDRGEKWRRYARSRIPIYWIVNLPERRIEVYQEPAGRGRLASYRRSESFGADDEISIILDGREVGRLAVREILP